MSGKRKLRRIARKGSKWSKFDHFDNVLDRRKGRDVQEDEAGLYYQMYRTKNDKKRKKFKKQLKREYGMKGGHFGHAPVNHAKTKVIAQRAGKA